MAEAFADLSHHNAVVDLASYARAGYSRVVLKATEGTTFTDPAFARRWAQAGAAGLHRGAYHFARTTTGGAAQADRLLAAVAAAGGLAAGDWLVLDLEDNSAPAAEARADEFAREFCGRMVARGHPNGMLYTGRWYANPAGVTPADVPAGWRRLWLSDYTNAADPAIALPAGWARSQVAARQFTDRATVPGIGGPVDCSRVVSDWLRQEEDDMTTTAEIEALLARFILGHESAPDANGQVDPHNLADVLIRFGQTALVGQGNKIFRGMTTGAAASMPVAAQLAVLSGQIRALTAAVTQLAAAAGASVDPDALSEVMRQAAHDGAAAALRELVTQALDGTDPDTDSGTGTGTGAGTGTSAGNVSAPAGG